MEDGQDHGWSFVLCKSSGLSSVLYDIDKSRGQVVQKYVDYLDHLVVCESGSPTACCPLKSRPATQKLNCLTLFIFLHASQIFSPFYHHGPKQSWYRSCHGASQLSYSSQARCGWVYDVHSRTSKKCCYSKKMPCQCQISIKHHVTILVALPCWQ